MKILSKACRRAALVMLASLCVSALWAQSGVLHMQQTQVANTPQWPTFLNMYHVLDSGKSSLDATSLTGTLTLTNAEASWSQVLYLIVYWKGACPADDINLTQIAGITWANIQKNPLQGKNTININLNFPEPVPVTGCIGLYYGGGPLRDEKVTMSIDLSLGYNVATANANKNVVLNFGGAESCFDVIVNCANPTDIDSEGFAFPVAMPAGHLLGLFGNISDSSFDGHNKAYGSLPTGESWGAVNEFYLIPGGCGIFQENLNPQGISNPTPLSTLHSWLPPDAMLVASVPLVDRTPRGTSSVAALQSQVQNFFSVPLKVNEGDCLLDIYGRTGNGASDDETQVLGLMAP